jgi:hypothetical protein
MPCRAKSDKASKPKIRKIRGPAAAEWEGNVMGGFTRTVGRASIVLWPVCFGIADEMQLAAASSL